MVAMNRKNPDFTSFSDGKGSTALVNVSFVLISLLFCAPRRSNYLSLITSYFKKQSL